MPSPTDLDAAVRDLTNRFLEEPLAESDSLAPSEITAAEARLGLRLPAALAALYRVAGDSEDVCRAHHFFVPPADLAVEQGYLVFLHENQSVLSWGFPVAATAEPDPVVWQRNNSSPSRWFSEEKTFTEFLTAMFEWYRDSYVWE